VSVNGYGEEAGGLFERGAAADRGHARRRPVQHTRAWLAVSFGGSNREEVDPDDRVWDLTGSA
jgi:hypothetical protein